MNAYFLVCSNKCLNFVQINTYPNPAFAIRGPTICSSMGCRKTRSSVISGQLYVCGTGGAAAGEGDQEGCETGGEGEGLFDSEGIIAIEGL